MLKCSKCGEMVEDGKNYCPNCGAILTHQKKKTSKPTAAGILLIIAASFCIVTGLVLSIDFIEEYNYFGEYQFSLTYYIIGMIFCFWAFAIGLVGGIYTIKRTNLTIAIIGVAFVIAAGCITIIYFFFSIPILILSILSSIFIVQSRQEFTKTK